MLANFNDKQFRIRKKEHKMQSDVTAMTVMTRRKKERSLARARAREMPLEVTPVQMLTPRKLYGSAANIPDD